MNIKFQAIFWAILILVVCGCQNDETTKTLEIRETVDQNYKAFCHMELIIQKTNNTIVGAEINKIKPIHQGGLDKIYWNYKSFMQEIDWTVGMDVLLDTTDNFVVNDSILATLYCYSNECVLMILDENTESN